MFLVSLPFQLLVLSACTLHNSPVVFQDELLDPSSFAHATSQAGSKQAITDTYGCNRLRSSPWGVIARKHLDGWRGMEGGLYRDEHRRDTFRFGIGAKNTEGHTHVH